MSSRCCTDGGGHERSSEWIVVAQVRKVAEENGVDVTEQIKELEERAQEVITTQELAWVVRLYFAVFVLDCYQW